jgi:hypothetical protein
MFAHDRRAPLAAQAFGLVFLVGLSAIALSRPVRSDESDAGRKRREARPASRSAATTERDGAKEAARANGEPLATLDETGDPDAGSDTSADSDTSAEYKPRRDIVLDDPELAEALRGLERDKEVLTECFGRRAEARKALDAIQAKYEAGTATLDALLAAQRRWADARLEYVNKVVDLGSHAGTVDGAVRRWVREQFAPQESAAPKLVEVDEGTPAPAGSTIRYHGKLYRIEGDDHWMYQYSEEQYPTILRLWIVQDGRDASLKLWRKVHAERAADKKKVSADQEMQAREQYYLFRAQVDKQLASLGKLPTK